MSLLDEKFRNETDDVPLNISKFLGHSDVLRLTSTNRMFKNFGHIDGLSLRKDRMKQMAKESFGRERLALEAVSNPPEWLPGVLHRPVVPFPTYTQQKNRGRVLGMLGGGEPLGFGVGGAYAAPTDWQPQKALTDRGIRVVFPRGEPEYRAFMGETVGNVRGGDDQTSDDD